MKVRNNTLISFDQDKNKTFFQTQISKENSEDNKTTLAPRARSYNNIYPTFPLSFFLSLSVLVPHFPPSVRYERNCVHDPLRF